VLSSCANGSLDYTDFNGMGMAAKPGGISALWIPECGPVILGSNHNVSYTNAVWGTELTKSRNSDCGLFKSIYTDICSRYLR
jgi:hypothetical protein